MPKKTATPPSPPTSPITPDWFQDRIREFRRIPAEQIEHHPKNPRRHGPDQKFAMRGLLETLGFIDALIVRELAPDRYQLLNGHMRHDLCEGAQALPCLIVDVTDEEADLIVATHDQVGEMATYDEVLADSLAKQLWSEDNQAINTILRDQIMWETHKEPKEREKEKNIQNQMDLAPLPYEHYDYVVILARNTMDYHRICAILQIKHEDFTVPGGDKRVGIGRCIDASRFIGIVDGIAGIGTHEDTGVDAGGAGEDPPGDSTTLDDEDQ